MLSTSSKVRSIQHVRTLKRQVAMPRDYTPELVPLSHPKKDHTGKLARHFKAWLGPKNIRGEYYLNKYFYPPQNHTPNYIVPDGKPVVGKNTEASTRLGRVNPALHPFPANPACKTASVISDDLKQKIFSDVVESGMHSQEVAHKYGIKLARVDAIVRLQQIEKGWKEEVRIVVFG